MQILVSQQALCRYLFFHENSIISNDNSVVSGRYIFFGFTLGIRDYIVGTMLTVGHSSSQNITIITIIIIIITHVDLTHCIVHVNIFYTQHSNRHFVTVFIILYLFFSIGRRRMSGKMYRYPLKFIHFYTILQSVHSMSPCYELFKRCSQLTFLPSHGQC